MTTTISSRIGEALAPGRTSLKRGPVGLLAAALFGFLVLPTPLFVLAVVEGWGEGEWTSGVSLLGVTLAVSLFIALLFGGSAWLLLRAARRESGRAYMIAGGVIGLAVSTRVLRSWRGLLDPAQSLVAAWIIVAAILAALIFWLIAREPRQADSAA